LVLLLRIVPTVEPIYEEMGAIHENSPVFIPFQQTYNPLQAYINTYDPKAEAEKLTAAVDDLEKFLDDKNRDVDMPDEGDISIQVGTFELQKQRRAAEVKLLKLIMKITNIILAILMIVIIFKFGIMSNACQSVENNCSELKTSNIIASWRRNNTFMNNADNVCFSSIALIEKDYKPVAANLPNRDHCEIIYYLGDRDYVYACRHDGDFSIVFTTADVNGVDFVDIGLTWRQFCSLMFMSDRLIDDLTHIMFSV
jgi:hypothetical protein